MTQKRGKFITLEGGEGAGKTTVFKHVIELVKRHAQLVTTREPGGTPLAEAVRGLLLDKTYTGMSADAELLLVFGARAEHIDKVIVPAINQGQWVLSDRFTDATYAYQGGGRGIDVDRIALIENWVQGDLRPDLTILLDVPVEVGMERASKRGELDRFESEQMEFFEKIRAAYLARANAEPQRFAIIDASQPLEAVKDAVSIVVNEAIRNDG